MSPTTKTAKKLNRSRSSIAAKSGKAAPQSHTPPEPQEFPISHSMLRAMYDAMLESRLWAQSRNLVPVISEATAVPAAAALHRIDTLAAPADGRTLYPVTHPETTIIPLDVAKVTSACQSARRKRGAAVIALCPDPVFQSSSYQQLLESARKNSWPLVCVALSNDFFQPGAPIPEIDVDGHDAVAMFRVVSEALRHVRNHRGPAIIHAHDATNTQTPDPLGDPLIRFERYLAAKGLTTQKLHIAHTT